MTDYYPLIARGVRGLENNTAESRRALYVRAETALIGQLRTLHPPFPEPEVTRERLSFHDAIRRIGPNWWGRSTGTAATAATSWGANAGCCELHKGSDLRLPRAGHCSGLDSPDLLATRQSDSIICAQPCNAGATRDGPVRAKDHSWRASGLIGTSRSGTRQWLGHNAGCSALRGGSSRCASEKTLRRLCDLENRDRFVGARTAARACNPRAARNPGAPYQHDDVAAPQHR